MVQLQQQRHQQKRSNGHAKLAVPQLPAEEEHNLGYYEDVILDIQQIIQAFGEQISSAPALPISVDSQESKGVQAPHDREQASHRSHHAEGRTYAGEMHFG